MGADSPEHSIATASNPPPSAAFASNGIASNGGQKSTTTAGNNSDSLTVANILSVNADAHTFSSSDYTNLNKLSAIHHRILDMELAGYTKKAIADELGLAPMGVVRITNSTLYKEKFAQRRNALSAQVESKLAEQITLAKKKLAEAAPHAADNLISHALGGTLVDGRLIKISPDDQIGSAKNCKDILNLNGIGLERQPTQQVAQTIVIKGAAAACLAQALATPLTEIEAAAVDEAPRPPILNLTAVEDKKEDALDTTEVSEEKEGHDA